MTPPLNLDAVFAAITTPGASARPDAVSDFAALVAAANFGGDSPLALPAQSVELTNAPTQIVDAIVPGDGPVVSAATVPAVANAGTVKAVLPAPDDREEKLLAPEQVAVRTPKPVMILSVPLADVQAATANAPDRPNQDDAEKQADQSETPVAETADQVSGIVVPAVLQVVTDSAPKPTKETPKTDKMTLASQPAARAEVHTEVRAEATAVTPQPAERPGRREARRGAESVGSAPALPDTWGRAPTLAALRASDAGSTTPDRRVPDFPAQLMHLAGDVLAVVDRDVQFNVRPTFLGPVSVTIERRDDGPALRLGVETQAAAQAVKQAEPLLTTSASPFVQVSVDLNSPGQRERSARTAAFLKRGREIAPDPTIEQAAVKTGRFA